MLQAPRVAWEIEPALLGGVGGQEVAALAEADGHADRLHDGEHFFPQSAAFGEIAGAEKVAGVVRDDDGDAVVFPALFLVRRKRQISPAEDASRGYDAQSYDDARLHEADFTVEDGRAQQNFSFGRGARVAGLARLPWAEFDNVGDVDLLSREPHGFQNAVQFPARFPLKRLAFLFIQVVGSISYEHDGGTAVSDAEDGFFS